jgi:hypothetical protein
VCGVFLGCSLVQRNDRDGETLEQSRYGYRDRIVQRWVTGRYAYDQPRSDLILFWTSSCRRRLNDDAALHVFVTPWLGSLRIRSPAPSRGDHHHHFPPESPRAVEPRGSYAAHAHARLHVHTQSPPA